MKLVIHAIGLLIALSVSVSASSDPDVGISKGQAVVLKIPRKLYRYEAVSIATGLGIYSVSLAPDAQSDAGLAIEMLRRWTDRGWPLMFEVYLAKINTKKEYTELEFRSTAAYIKLRFSSEVKNLKDAVASVVFIGGVQAFQESSYYSQTLVKKILPQVFTGPLALMPTEKQLGLLKALNYNDDGLGSESFKGKTYISFSATDPTSVFNSLRVNQSSRAATTLKGLVLPGLKAAAGFIEDVKEIHGIKIKGKMLYRDFLNERYAAPHVEVIEVFAPYDLVAKYFNLDITDQELIRGSVVLIDGNRVEIDLSQAAAL